MDLNIKTKEMEALRVSVIYKLLNMSANKHSFIT